MTLLTVVFDLDGTLVDTAPDLIDTLNVVLANEGLPPVEITAAHRLIGGGVRKTIEGGLRLQGRSMSNASVDRMFDDFIAHYTNHIADRSRPFPGVEAALDDLAAQGHRLAICTNKYENLSRLLLDALGLSHRFVAICGQDTFGVLKPDPEILRRTIQAAGGEIRHTIMVGDSGLDIATARAAGVPVVAVDFGYSETPVRQLRPDRVIGHFDQLAAAFVELTRTGAAPQKAKV